MAATPASASVAHADDDDQPAVAIVQIRDLVKSYPGESRAKGPVRAVKNVSFDVHEGEFFTMLGPSGCGKTTTLRCVAGLETPDSGEITVAGKPFYSSAAGVDVPVNARGIGMVFQSYAIWPHMSVYENVAFPLRVLKRSQRPGKATITERVHHALAMVQLDALEDRRATNLSGGQQQRLALARALVAQPSLMLLDEPLSNLDAKLRDSMRDQLKRLQRDLRLTSMYVTHDQIEALALSTRIAVMRDGQVEQIGRPREIYERPKTKFVADFIGRSNFLVGTVRDVRPDGVHVVESAPGVLSATGVGGHQVGDEVVVAIRPEHVVIDPADGPASDPMMWTATVESRQFLGEQIDYAVRLEDDSELTIRANPGVSIPPGRTIRVLLPSEHCRVLHA
jgi:iron(III) transport system ATP-binding protein